MKKWFFLTLAIYSASAYAVVSHINFDESMQYASEAEQEHWLRKFCKNLYERTGSLAPEEHTIIPKIAHLIWIGPQDPPPIYKKCVQSIKKHLPLWECIIWTDKEINDFGLQNQTYYDEESNYGAKSDIARYEILYRFGGVYLDVDFVVLKSLDVLHHTYQFYTGMMPANCKAVLSNGIIGSIPGHPILKDTIDMIKKRRKAVAIERRTGPIHFQKSFYSVVKESDDRVIALPRSFFFPLDQTHKSLTQEQLELLIKPEAFAVHFWSGSWKKGTWKNRPQS